MSKALLLFSGGLDSVLAAKVLQEQGVEVTGLCFASNFYNARKAEKNAERISLELMVRDISESMLDLVKNPPSGYGRNVNPCLDCHALMFRQAGQIAKDRGFDLVATGEVLGQRPFSQTRGALLQVNGLADTEVLRPLSARLLPETEAERQGLVKRNRLLALQGRAREAQMELAEKFGIREYESPAGGCLLTDEQFAERLLKMLGYWPDCDINDVELLKNGRIFWLRGYARHTEEEARILMVVGRQEDENCALERLARKGDFMVQLKEVNGPTTLVRAKSKSVLPEHGRSGKLQIPKHLERRELQPEAKKEAVQALELARLFTGYYATKARGQAVRIAAQKI